MASNLERLKAAGVVPDDAKLSTAELAVIDGLDAKEMETLIGIREKLGDQMAKEQEKSAALSMPEVTPNFII